MRADYEPFFSFARATGLRLRECFVQWGEVDWGAQQILKPGRARGAFVYLLRRQSAQSYGRSKGISDGVFSYVATRTKDGRIKGQRYPLTYNGLKAAWKRLRKRAGVQNFRFHDFRHDLASKLLRETGNLKLVQRALTMPTCNRRSAMPMCSMRRWPRRLSVTKSPEISPEGLPARRANKLRG